MNIFNSAGNAFAVQKEPHLLHSFGPTHRPNVAFMVLL